MVDRERQGAAAAPSDPGGEPHAPAKSLRIALAHDWLVGMRGGERVLEAIARALAREHRITAVYTMFDDGRALSPDLDAIPKRVSWLGRVAGANRLRRWLLALYPAAVGSLSRRVARDHAREPFDLLISTSSAAIKGLRAPAGVPHLCYCHTPARYLWSQREQYAGGLRGLGLRVVGASLRAWDSRTAANVGAFLANSTHTQNEIRRCYGRESDVLFPPVRTDYFTPADRTGGDRASAGGMAEWLRAIGVGDRAFWLAVGALEAYKRFDLAIEASRLAGVPLVIVGGGSDEARLRRLAPAHVTFAGRVGDDRLRDLYRTARLLVFPQVEDFGIIAAEAQACGCPVLARAAGGALDTVVGGRVGAMFEGEGAGAVVEAALRVPERSEATTAACRANAERFSEAAFAAGLRRAVAAITYDRPDDCRDPA